MINNSITKIYSLLDKKDQKIFFFVLLSYFGSIILELFSLVLVVPLVQIFLTDTNQTSDIFFLNLLPNNLIKDNSFSFLAFFVLLFIFKNLILIRILKLKNDFLFTIQSNISKKLFKSYISENYNFFYKNSASKIANIVIAQAQSFKSGLETLIIFIVDGVLILSITFFLISFNYIITLAIISLISLFVIFFYPIIKKKTKKFGELRIKYGEELLRLVNESFFGIKTVKIFNKEIFFKNIFNLTSDNAWNNESKNVFLLEIPKYIIETIIIVFFVLILIFFIYFDFDKNYIITFCSFFVFAIYKMLPSFNKITAAVHNLRYFLPTLEIISKRIFEDNTVLGSANKKNIIQKKISFEKKLLIQDLSFKYQDSKNNIFSNINLEIKKNSFIGIMGPSGSGKTTLIDLITGLIKPIMGSICVDDIVINEINAESWRDQIGYVSQETFLFDGSIISNIIFDFSETNYDKEKLALALKYSNVNSFVNDLPDKLNTNIGANGIMLSGGQKQRIGIARALYKNSELIILDEFTSSLDKYNEKVILDEIRRLKEIKTVILITHRETSLIHCDKKYEVKNFSLVEK